MTNRPSSETIPSPLKSLACSPAWFTVNRVVVGGAAWAPGPWAPGAGETLSAMIAALAQAMNGTARDANAGPGAVSLRVREYACWKRPPASGPGIDASLACEQLSGRWPDDHGGHSWRSLDRTRAGVKGPDQEALPTFAALVVDDRDSEGGRRLAGFEGQGAAGSA